MLMKTRKLTGVSLDWAFVHAEHQSMRNIGEYLKKWVVDAHESGERPAISVYQKAEQLFNIMVAYNLESSVIKKTWFVYSTLTEYVDGTTLYEAVARCYICILLGEEVDIPTSLLKNFTDSDGKQHET